MAEVRKCRSLIRPSALSLCPLHAFSTLLFNHGGTPSPWAFQGHLPAQLLCRRGLHPTPVLVNLLLLATQQTHKDLDALPHDPRANALESLNARFVWIPDLGKEDIVGMVAEHATRAGIKSIAILT